MPDREKIKAYFETTVFNRFFDDGREYNEDTVRLFSQIGQGFIEPFTSTAVIDELELAPEPKRSNMLKLISEYGIKTLEINGEVRELAEAYIKAEIIPPNYAYDALHVAAAAVNDMDCIVSLNFRHINKLKTKNAAKAVNLLKGYSNPDICTPMEVI
jgi:predicted nucleic acid-binding protein